MVSEVADNEHSSSESVGRIVTVAEDASEPLTTVDVQPSKGFIAEQITFLADSGVSKTLMVLKE